MPNRVALILLAALALAGGCKEPVVEVIEGVNTTLQVVVTNPTACPMCDPFVDIDTLRLDVSVGDDIVASDSFVYPGEGVTLPDLSPFGVVRITLLGLADGRVLSAGRTAEIVLLPNEDLTVPLAFVPANRVLPLAAPMLADRYRPTAVPRRDGSLLVVGGLDPMRERATALTELYDPLTALFVEAPPLPRGVAAPDIAVLPEGARMLVGGFAAVGGNAVAVETASVFDDTAGTLVEAGPLSVGRDGGCVAMFRERQGIAFGGAAGIAADYLKPDPETGLWGFEALNMRDFDQSAVTACAVFAEGRVFVQGRDAASTGVWSEDDAPDPGEAFTAINEGGAGEVRYVSGPTLLPSADGGLRILGGADVTTGEVYADGRLYAPSAGRFAEINGFAAPRFDAQLVPWMLDGWYVAGCGWADAARATDEPTLELLAPEVGERSPLYPLDRERPGCALGVLPDGAILVVGGGAQGVPEGAPAAMLVPWLDVLAPL